MRKLRFYILVFLITATPAFAGFAIYYKYYTAVDRGPLVREAEKFVHQELDLSKLETVANFSTPARNGNEKYWAIYMVSDCGACKKLLPLAEKVRQEPDSDLKVVGIMAESDENILRFVEEHQIKFPILRDTGAAFMKSMNLRYFPASFLVNDGIISKAFFGMPRDQETIRSFLQDQSN